MLTIQTSVYSENDKTLKGILRKFLNVICHPCKTQLLKKYELFIKELKQKAYFSDIKILQNTDDADKFIPILKADEDFPEVHHNKLSEEDNKWLKNYDEKYFLYENKDSGEKECKFMLHTKDDVYIPYMKIDSSDSQKSKKKSRYNVHDYIYTDRTGWFNISGIELKQSYFKKDIKTTTLVLDKHSARLYKFHNAVYKTVQKFGYYVYKTLHTIDSVILCVRFPFLYTRNRFTGRHYNNYKLSQYTQNLSKKALFTECVRFYEKNAEEYSIYNDHIFSDNCLPVVNKELANADKMKAYVKPQPKYNYYYEFNRQKVYLVKDKVHFPVNVHIVEERSPAHTDKCIYTEEFGWIDINDFGNPTCSFEHKENDEKLLYIDNYYNEVINYPLYAWIKIVDFFHDYVLGLIFSIPTTNELDAMDEGWRRAFGIEMCKKIRKQLIKDKMLFSYRIMQIKEKFGTLRWYDATSSKEIMNIINEYEHKSYYTCVDCGKPATWITTGWICPFCDDCIGDSVYKARRIGEKVSEDDSETDETE